MTTAPIPHAIQHRDTYMALIVLEGSIGILTDFAKPGSKLAGSLATVRKWVRECIKDLLKKKKPSAGTERDMRAISQKLGEFMMCEGNGLDMFKSWSAQYWTGFTMFLDARRRCTDFTIGRPWGWLERTGWSLGYLLMELAPGCDVAGTDIFLDLA